MLHTARNTIGSRDQEAMSRKNSIKLGILLPTRGVLLKERSLPDLSPIFELASYADEAGLDSVWVGDSLLAKPRLEPLATLASIAMKTQHVRLGTAVMLAPLRHPVHLAQMAATVDLISGGRLTLGMGVGGVFTDAQKAEWAAVSVPYQERGRRLTELVQVCRNLWTNDNVTFHGKYYDVKNANMLPKPLQSGGVPILLACHLATGSEAQYQRAGYYADGIISISDSPVQYAQTLQRVQGYALEAGRDPAELITTFYMTVNLHQDREIAWREADSFIRDYYGLNFWAGKWGPFGPPHEVAHRILEYYNAGAQEIIVRFASYDQLPQLQTFVRDVMPIIQRVV